MVICVDMIVTKRLEEIPHPNKWKGVEAGWKMRTAKGKRTFVVLGITDTHVTIDGNEELAGQDLIFTIVVEKVVSRAAGGTPMSSQGLTEKLMQSKR